MKNQTPDSPCKDCITLSICKASLLKTDTPYFKLFSLVDKCKLIKDYFRLEDDLDIFKDKYNKTLKIFKIYKLKEKQRILHEKTKSNLSLC